MPYVDGFVIPIPKKKIAEYTKIAKQASKIWMEYGALEYFECVGDDLDTHCGVPFPKLVKTKPSETVVFSWIVYKTKAQRDKVNKQIMKDPRILGMMDEKSCPFDPQRMTFGGFEVIVKA